MSQIKPSLVVSQPSSDPHFSVVGDTYRIVISGKQTNGEMALIEMYVPPGGGPGPHAHAAFQETFFMLEGEIDVRSEAGNRKITRGMSLTVPKGGMVHAFRNNSQEMAHLLCYVSPAGLDAFFEEIGQPVKQGEFLPHPKMNPRETERIQKIAEAYGQKLYPPDYLG